jgi:hypothetical protein
MLQRESAYSMVPGNRTRQANRCWSLLNRMGSMRGLTALAYCLLLLSPSPSAAQSLRDALPLPPGLALLPGEEARAMPGCNPFHLLARGAPIVCRDLLLGESSPALLSADDVPSSQLQPPAEARRPQKLLALLLSTGVLAGSAANWFTESPHQSFHVTHEGFFGEDKPRQNFRYVYGLVSRP